MYSIKLFASKTGLSTYTLRFYEKLQLLDPHRQANGHRYYTEQDLSWVHFIMPLKDKNMPLKTIQHYAALRQQGNTTLARRLDILLNHQHTIEQQLEALQGN
ncbi:MerR family transcriptional regulator [Alkanindiges hydrocarboniclasticus]|nr:MerR family transcriptional regulator [Alkanindiges hydrocarboniclasticus]